MSQLRGVDNLLVPFNNLNIIHEPLIDGFKADLEDCVNQSDFVLGESVLHFEQLLKISEECKYAVSVNSGTAALELSLRALGLVELDEIIVPAMTFAATAFAAVCIGARIKICDINSQSGNITVEELSGVVSTSTKAVIFVSLHGRVDGLKEIFEFCQNRGILLIVDGAQSQGTRDFGAPIATECDVYTLSFYPGKNLGALGEGGAVCTNNPSIANRVKSIRNWGSSSDRYHTEVWGGNFRLPSLQARFLARKLPLLTLWNQQRQQIATWYRKYIDGALLLKEPLNPTNHSFHVYGILVHDRPRVENALRKEGIGYGFHYPRAIPDHAFYSRVVLNPNTSKNARRWATSQISLPMFPGLVEDEVKFISNVITSAQ